MLTDFIRYFFFGIGCVSVFLFAFLVTYWSITGCLLRRRHRDLRRRGYHVIEFEDEEGGIGYDTRAPPPTYDIEQELPPPRYEEIEASPPKYEPSEFRVYIHEPSMILWR
ncbi:hypothetical protein LTR56_015555 [Elasticomyces elasticus]|nr:hypothetical protein LTR56_015555 [Elasticomyces elasticus]KAK3648296.1 hypothetical protein LTR22_013427 [Elasticomyces elasticus]KAK4916286.1 hypothetical protein LTR49_015658 [Elasticomyces elasticus]KAK5764954.1 hypothetical protein LTS12_004982 [Elasticomyces elasticus]